MIDPHALYSKWKRSHGASKIVLNYLSLKRLVEWVEKECITRGVDPATLDFEAIVDPMLNFGENKAILSTEMEKVSESWGAEVFEEYEEFEKKIAERDTKIVKLESELARLRKILRARPAERIRRLCCALILPLKVERETWKLYRKSNPHGPVQQETIPALVWLASRKHGIPLPHRKVAELALMDRRTFSSRCWRLVKKLDLRFQPLNPRELLSSAGERLSLPEKVLERARTFWKKMGFDVFNEYPKWLPELPSVKPPIIVKRLGHRK